MSLPLITIITPCYNSEGTIERTIKSIIDQNYGNIQYIVVDGKSSDRTLDIVEKYRPYFKDRLLVISEKDNGIYDAMNKGISKAGGDLIGIINSDDWYENNAFETVAKIYQESQESMIVIYGMLKVWRGSELCRIYMNLHRFIEENMITHPTCFVDRRVYQNYGVYNTKYKSSADYEFILRTCRNEKIEYKPVYTCLANFRVGGTSSGQRGIRETAAIKYKYGIIKKKKYIFTCIKSFLYENLH